MTSQQHHACPDCGGPIRSGWYGGSHICGESAVLEGGSVPFVGIDEGRPGGGRGGSDCGDGGSGGSSGGSDCGDGGSSGAEMSGLGSSRWSADDDSEGPGSCGSVTSSEGAGEESSDGGSSSGSDRSSDGAFSDSGDDYLLRFEAWGQPKGPLDPAHREIFEFLAVISTGAGMSALHATTVLRYCRSLGGRGALLPVTITACWSALRSHHREHTDGIPGTIHRMPIPDTVRAMMPGGVEGADTHAEFECEHIISQLVGILRSPAWMKGHVALGYEESDAYGDYCNGERMARCPHNARYLFYMYIYLFIFIYILCDFFSM